MDRGTYQWVHVSRKGAKTQRDRGARGGREVWGGLFRKVGYVQRSLTEQGSDTHDPPSPLYLARAVQVMDRGTYQCVHVSRKGGHVSRKGAKTQRDRGRKEGREVWGGLFRKVGYVQRSLAEQ